MNSYDVLKKFGTVLLIDENRLNQIKDEFEKDYLSSKMYFEKKAKHRKKKAFLKARTCHYIDHVFFSFH